MRSLTDAQPLSIRTFLGYENLYHLAERDRRRFEHRKDNRADYLGLFCCLFLVSLNRGGLEFASSFRYMPMWVIEGLDYTTLQNSNY